MMRPTTERRSSTWYSCAQPTTWSWTQARPRRLLWSIGGPGELNMFLSAYMARKWNVWITLSSWSSTSFIWPVLVSEHLTSGKEAPTSSFFLRKLKHAGLSFQLRVNVDRDTRNTLMDTGPNFLILKKWPHRPNSTTYRNKNSWFCSYLLPYNIKILVAPKLFTPS